MSVESYLSCDLCGSSDSRFVLDAADLDGPLVECSTCGLRYVGFRRSNLAFGNDATDQTARRLAAANIHFKPLPLDEEHRLASLNARKRLRLIQGFKKNGKLLEVGCGRGDFLRAAGDAFEVYGVEPNPELAAEAKHAAPVHAGVLGDTPWWDFDVAATFHVIEHVDSPARFITEIARRLKPGGLLVIETPNIDSLPYRLFKKRWRQFIPEHYYFFDGRALSRVLSNHGFRVEKTMAIGKYASVELILNRLARYSRLALRAGSTLRSLGVGRITFWVNPLDIMLMFATKLK